MQDWKEIMDEWMHIHIEENQSISQIEKIAEYYIQDFDFPELVNKEMIKIKLIRFRDRKKKNKSIQTQNAMLFLNYYYAKIYSHIFKLSLAFHAPTYLKLCTINSQTKPMDATIP